MPLDRVIAAVGDQYDIEGETPADLLERDVRTPVAVGNRLPRHVTAAVAGSVRGSNA